MTNQWGKWSAAEKIQAIISIWEAGMSAGEIANAVSQKYDTAVTRNAVVGLYHRTNTGPKGERGMSPLKKYPLNSPNHQSASRRAELARRKQDRMRERERRMQMRVAEARAKIAKKEKRVDATIKTLNPALITAVYDASSDLPKEGYGVPLIDLRKSGCRWPTDRVEGRTVFCDLGGYPYCEAHSQRSVRYATRS